MPATRSQDEVTLEEAREVSLKRYKVWIRTRGGMYAQYNGAVSVWAEDDEDAIERAFRDLKRGAFPDYSRSMWKVERVERVGA